MTFRLQTCLPMIATFAFARRLQLPIPVHVFRKDPTTDRPFLQFDNVVLLQRHDSGMIGTCNAMSQLLCDNLAVRFFVRSLPTPVA